MDSAFVRELLQLNDIEQVRRRIREQRDDILAAIAEGHVKPDKQLTDYLGELNVAAGDVPEVQG